MGLAAQLYDLTADEAIKLTDAEANFLVESAQLHMLQMATTSPAMKEILKQRLAPTIKQVREARNKG